MAKLISVIIPVYKVEDYITKCIDSVINQTYKNIEIIIVDDGSPDNCPKICDNFEKIDPRIRVIHKKNGGLSDARNTGIDVAQGCYFVFVDSDDFIAPQMIEKMYNQILIDDSDLVVCNYTYVDETGIETLSNNIQDIEPRVIGDKEFWNEFYGIHNIFCVVAWNKLYKRNLFSNIRYDIGKVNEDEFIIHKIISQTNRISLMSDKFYYYLQRENSIMSASFSVKNLDVIEAMICRSFYFVDTNYIFLAERTIVTAVEYMINLRKLLDMKDNQNRNRYFKLKKMLGKSYRNIVSNKASRKFSLTIFIFLLNEQLYAKLKYGRRKVRCLRNI